MAQLANTDALTHDRWPIYGEFDVSATGDAEAMSTREASPSGSSAPSAGSDPHTDRAGWAIDLDRRMVDALGGLRETELEIRWSPSGRAHESTQIIATEQLAVWIRTLAPSEWAVISLPADEDDRWAQVMCVGDDWIVEVHDGTAQEWASRVLRDDVSASDGPDAAEAWEPLAAAAIAWAWMHGNLPEGCHRVALKRRRAGSTDGVVWCTASLA